MQLSYELPVRSSSCFSSHSHSQAPVSAFIYLFIFIFFLVSAFRNGAMTGWVLAG